MRLTILTEEFDERDLDEVDHVGGEDKAATGLVLQEVDQLLGEDDAAVALQARCPLPGAAPHPQVHPDPQGRYARASGSGP